MTTTRAAKYLAPIDLGKTITVTDADTDKTVTGELHIIDAVDYNIELGILAGKDSGRYRVNHDDEITITGQPSPAGSDQAQPTQQLPAPIPAAPAADHEIDYRDLQRTINEANLAGARAYEDELWQKATQQLPAPIPAAQAADASSYYGPACCIGDCCGPGSYCCKHPENNHAHPLDDDDEPEHEHAYALGNPTCLRCGATDPDQENLK